MKYIRDLPFSEYLAIEAESNSSMKAFIKSPLHYAHARSGPSESTPAQAFGTLTHTVLLEPMEARKRYAPAPDVDRRTKAGKATWAEFEAENHGKIIITNDAWDTAHAIRDQLLTDPEFRRLIGTGGDTELTATGTDADTGLAIKARADLFRDGVVVDLKTATDASPHGFARAVATYKYHLQDAHYQEMFKVDRFVFIAVEPKPPHAHGIYTLCEASIEQGRIERRRALDGIAEHRERKVWPGYGVQELSLPNWAFDDEDIEVML